MATKVFVSFRYSDGVDLKEELVKLFDESTEVLNRSEDQNRSEMTKETIRKYLYEKLKETSVTIVILTPKAIEYKKDILGKYDDWLYDELRYSLEDRKENRTNGVVALYTDESKGQLMKVVKHKCENCNEESEMNSILDFNNLVRKNMMNVKEDKKHEKCTNVYHGNHDSYISLIHFDDFKKNYSHYIDLAKNKRERKDDFEIVKQMD